MLSQPQNYLHSKRRRGEGRLKVAAFTANSLLNRVPRWMTSNWSMASRRSTYGFLRRCRFYESPDGFASGRSPRHERVRQSSPLASCIVRFSCPRRNEFATRAGPARSPGARRLVFARLTSPRLRPRNRFLRHCSDPPPSAPDFATAIRVLPARHHS